MNFFKNRTVIGLLCIVLSLVICFAITPMFNRTISEKTEIVRVTKNIRIGDEITKDMVKPVEVGAYNLPESVVRNMDEVIGKYASADMAPGDYIIRSKVAEEPAAENAYLYNLNGEKQAISVSVKAFANGLSGKLISGDIVSVIAPDYRKQGSTIIPPEQGKVLAELEADGKLHLSLVYRGTKENARKFVEAQEIMLEELYSPEGEGTEENTEKESGNEETETVEESGEETVQGEETGSTAGSGSGVE